jgi:hypothetical protein
MKTEKWVCRTFVVAAMSATVAVPMSGAAQGMQDSAVSRNSGKAQVHSASHQRERGTSEAVSAERSGDAVDAVSGSAECSEHAVAAGAEKAG